MISVTTVKPEETLWDNDGSPEVAASGIADLRGETRRREVNGSPDVAASVAGAKREETRLETDDDL